MDRIAAGLRRPRSRPSLGWQHGAQMLTIAAGAAVLAIAPDLAWPRSFGEMFEAGETSLIRTTGFLAMLIYVIGAVTVFGGLVGLVRTVRYPQQAGYAAPLIAIAVGAAMIMLPAVVNAVNEGFGGDSGATLTRPSL